MTGAIWGVVGLSLAYAMLAGKSRAPTFVRLTALAFTCWYWADRLLLARSDYSALSRPADAVINLMLLTVLLWGLGRDGTREYFGEKSV
jgi:hypothetical protein